MAKQQVRNLDLATDTNRQNLLTNPGFEQWQRGNGPFTSNTAWFADRWRIYMSGAPTMSVSKDTTNQDAASIACAAITVGGGPSSANPIQIYQIPEVPAIVYQLR